LRPDYVPALKNRGMALAAAKRFDEAVASFDRALELSPQDADIRKLRDDTLKQRA
jgi:Flp pilus assembly protein TadD